MPSGLRKGSDTPAVAVENGDGQGALVLLCDHASNRFPPPYDTSLGISATDKSAHVSWDPGALGLARLLSEALDAPLVYPTVSRLIIDCNREESRPDLTPCLSETVQVPGNRNVSAEEKAYRLNLAHRPFHKTIDKLLNARSDRGQPSAVVSIHSFTPVYKGNARPWQIGLVYDSDQRLAESMLAGLRALETLTVGDNEPYAPADGVYYTIRRHGEDRGLPCLMIEVRNDELKTPEAERRWAELLAPHLRAAIDAALSQQQGATDE